MKVSKFEQQKAWFNNRREDINKAIERTKLALNDLEKQTISNKELLDTLNTKVNALRQKEGKTNLLELEKKFVFLETENQIRNQSLLHSQNNVENLNKRLKDDLQRLDTIKKT